MILHSLKLTGSATVVTLASLVPGYVPGNAGPGGKWVQVSTPPTNSASVLIGGAEVSSTVGFPIPVGWAGQLLPPIAEEMEYYDLTKTYVYAANDDVLNVLYGG